MKLKYLLVLTIILVCLLVVTFFYHKLAKQAPLVDKPYGELSVNSYNRIEIIKEDETYTFQKENSQWKIVSLDYYPADQKGIDDLLDRVRKLEVGDIISTRQQKQAEFQVDHPGKGLQIKIYQDKEKKSSVSFILGKRAFDYLHYYFRYPLSNEIRVCKGLPRYILDKDLKQWRDKTILICPRDKIRYIELTHPKETVELIKKEDKWILAEAKEEIEVETNKINPILDILSNLKTDDFVEKKEIKDLKDFGLDKPQLKVVVKFEDREGKILIGDKKDYQYYLKKEDKDTIFLVNSYKMDKLKKKRKDLKEEKK